MRLKRNRAVYDTAGIISETEARQAIEYAAKRVQFGVPIARHQSIQFMLADMAKDIEAARLLVWKSAWLADQGVRNSKEAAMAKAFASDVAMRVTSDAVQIYGGMGYTKWHPVEKLMRDAKVIQIYEGTAQIMRLIISRHLLGGSEALHASPGEDTERDPDSGKSLVTSAFGDPSPHKPFTPVP